ncbi:short transient receptor potential channel 4-associated protein-like isoform X2 [Rhopilema esculentum]|uniref:short transient receptor potential channel 4-associated protein-like isoform X2 n=1 Tax=Rhopilema esculentum TaxID=499914 RepID=UPI0031DADF10
MTELGKQLRQMSIQEKKSQNIYFQIFGSQITGRGSKIHSSSISTQYLKSLESKFTTRGIPTILRQLSSCFINGDEASCHSTVDLLKKLHGIQSSDNMLFRRRQKDDGSNYIPGFSRSSQLIDLFGGIGIIIGILFDPHVRPSRDLNNMFATPRHSSALQLEIRSMCLDILHDIFLNVDGATSEASKKDELIEYLFIMMEERKTFSCASVVLEDLLASNRKIVKLSKIANVHNLIISLRDDNFASFCRILSIVIADIDFSEDRNTLLAQDEEEKRRAVEKSVADANQAMLLSFPEFLVRMVKVAGKNLRTPVSESAGRRLENVIIHGTSANVATFLDELATLNFNQGAQTSDDLLADDDLASVIPRRLRYVHEVMYKVEILYILTLFLNGKGKVEVQSKLGDLKLIPILSDIFDRLGWNYSSERFPTHNHSEAEDCDCTPESALKIQFLRFVHSFCDHSEKKHLLLSTREVEEMYKICKHHQLDVPEGLDKSKRLRCRGEKGLLTKILDVLKRTTPNNALRFWLSRAIEGFLRGRVSPPDQHFLINRDVIEHLLEHINNPETKSKEILQSSFDLLGELMKFNEEAFKRFNTYFNADAQFDRFISTMTSNVIDSNMFIRCIVLSLERFSSSSCAFLRQNSCRLSDLIKKWEHKMYLMYKLITSISVDNLTQENVSCLNTTLIFLMFAHNHGQLGQYLQAFFSEEQAQHHPGLILLNLRDLLEFWRMHYLQRGKDRIQLEQSSCIEFDHWQGLVDILLHKDAARLTAIVHYLLPWQQQTPSRIRSSLLQRDA